MKRAKELLGILESISSSEIIQKIYQQLRNHPAVEGSPKGIKLPLIGDIEMVSAWVDDGEFPMLLVKEFTDYSVGIFGRDLFYIYSDGRIETADFDDLRKEFEKEPDELEAIESIKDFVEKVAPIFKNITGVSESSFSRGERMALSIVHQSLQKQGGFAVYRQGIGTEYFQTEKEAQDRMAQLKAKGYELGAMILTKESPVFKQAGII